MIFNKNVVATVALLLSVSLQAHAHAAISPALGVKGQPQRSDVQRPSDAKPCGNINIAQNIDSSKAIQLKPDNTFSTTIQNFNAGFDGSLQVDKVVVDASGTGKKFVAAQMVKNGEKNPPKIASAAISVKLPSGTKCQGGKNKDRCVVSLKTAGGFGNCVVLQQAKAAKSTNAQAKANASVSGASTVTAAASSSVLPSSVPVASSVNATSVAVSTVAAANSTVVATASTIDSSAVTTASAVPSTILLTIPAQASLTTVSASSATQDSVASIIASDASTGISAAATTTQNSIASQIAAAAASAGANASTGFGVRAARPMRRAELKNRMDAA